MKALLLANIGSRDLQLDGGVIKPARTKGEEIRNNLEEYKDRLTTPILSPIIRLIGDSSLDIVLFYTDQEDERYRENDSLFFAECIREMWKKHKVFLEKINGSPNLYDEMFDFYQLTLEEHRKRGIFEGYEHIYVSLTGGTPQCNMALCLHSIRLFGSKCIPVYTIEGKDRAIPLQVGRQLIDDLMKRVIKELIKNYDYKQASLFLSDPQKLSEVNQRLSDYDYKQASSLLSDLGRKSLAKLAELCVYRLNFDFKRAGRLVKELIAQERGKIRSLCLEIQEELERLEDRKLEALISELYHNLEIKYERGEYVDFLGRIFRFEEAILRFIIEREGGITTDIDPDNRNFKDYQASLSNIKGLRDYLEGYRFEGNPLTYDKPNIPTLLAILEFMVEKREMTHLTALYERLNILYKLTSLRNKSILGHGFSGVSLEDFQEIIPDLGYIKGMISDLGIELGKSPYHRVNRFILESICQPSI